MTENWDSYFCTVDNQRASVLVNLGLAASAPLPRNPVLGYAAVFLEKPDEDGFPAPEEEKALAGMEDSLVAALEKEYGAVCAGHCLSAGRLEIFFYMPDDASFRQAAADVLNTFAPYAWETGTHLDPAWELYFDFLFPDAQTLLSMQNRRVYDQLRELGDTLTQARWIEHWADFASREAATAFGDAVQLLGYRVDEISLQAEAGQDSAENDFTLPASQERISPALGEDHAFWLARFSRSDLPGDMDELGPVLAQLAKNHSGAYQGWSCQAVVE